LTKYGRYFTNKIRIQCLNCYYSSTFGVCISKCFWVTDLVARFDQWYRRPVRDVVSPPVRRCRPHDSFTIYSRLNIGNTF